MIDAGSCPSTHGVWTLCSDLTCVIAWLDHWQTLVAGLAAVIAAVVSIHYLRRQIADTAKAEATRRKRRLAAARSRLQLALSDVVHYADESISLLKQYLDATGGPRAGINALASSPRPVLPEQAILVFEAVIEATDDDNFAGVIADTISRMQVLSSRIGGLAAEGRALGRLNLHSYLLNGAEVHAYASGMFEYARRETDVPPHSLDWAQVRTALNLRGLYVDHYEDLHAFLGRAAERAGRKVGEGG